jgi:flagellar motor switch protein FliG
MNGLRSGEAGLKYEDLTGVQKVAVLLLYLGEGVAAEIFGRLSENEIMKIGAAMATVEAIPAEVVDGVVGEFLDRFAGQKGVTANGMDYLKRVVRASVGEDRARRIMRGLDTREQAQFQQKLAKLNPESLAALMKGEHPQTAAVICSLLGTSMTAKVLNYFPAEARNDIIYRMASLERIPPEVMDQVKEFIDREIQIPITEEDQNAIKAPETKGIDRVAELLNALGKAQNESIIQNLIERNSRLAEEITKKMFAFEDLLRIDDRGMQSLLKEIGKEELAMALKIADDTIKEKFFRNMSERAAEFLRDDMEVMGPVRFKDVETAQRQIISIALRLEEEGKILIAPKEGQDY